MKSSYFVMYQKDFEGNGLKGNRHKREIYDKMKQFSSLEKSVEFVLDKMHEDPILAKIGQISDGEIPRYPDTPYVIAISFEEKYRSYDFTGDSDPVPAYEIVRCNQSELETKLRSLAQEMPNKIYWGIELKLLPETGGN